LINVDLQFGAPDSTATVVRHHDIS
jgi:hypothetical protein